MTNAVQTPVTEAEARSQFFRHVREASAAFLKVKQRREYRSLSPRFWVAWLNLDLAISDELTFEQMKPVFKDAYEQMKPVFKDAYRWLGAPGDFGYDTPQGKGLQGVYYAWNVWCQAAKPQPATA